MNNKVALVTGGSRGIGKGIALKLAKDGYDIAIADIAEVKETIEEIKALGVNALFIQGDISKKESRENLVDCCLKEFGKIDVLVNNAGVAPKVRMDMLETTEESMDFVLGINLKGTFFLTQLVASKMIEGIETKKQENPRIINIASVSSYTSSPARPEYCISKAGVSMMTKLFADRLAEFGILVYEIRPGVIMTDMTSVVKDKYDKLISEGLAPIKRWGYPEDIANAISALCGDGFLFSTGEVINVDGGFHIRRL
ncbi:MAG: 3-ketoacyl-ACP reductase [Clostridiales bacterium]|nr:3-ketoacyl-ACP reductase [Clostridiales bacterium]